MLFSTGRTVTISVTDSRFAQKVFGGVIKAKRVKNLAIPLEPEAYGRSPRTFEAETGMALFFLRANGRSFLAHAQDITDVKVFYLLTPSVNQQPDATALPDHEHLARVVIAAAQAAADQQNQQGGKK